MVKLISIPDTDHVLRFARHKHLIRDHNEKVIGCDHSLFKHRNDEKFIAQHGGPEKNLSVNYLEHFKGTDKEKLRQTVIDFRDGQQSKKLSKNTHFSKLNVGELKATCQPYSTKVRVIHDANPKARIKSHASINQLPQDNDLLFEDLCNLAFQNLMTAEEALK